MQTILTRPLQEEGHKGPDEPDYGRIRMYPDVHPQRHRLPRHPAVF
jgi:hypothetical protein